MPRVVRQRPVEHNGRPAASNTDSEREPAPPAFTILPTAHVVRAEPKIRDFQLPATAKAEPTIPAAPPLPVRAHPERIEPAAAPAYKAVSQPPAHSGIYVEPRIDSDDEPRSAAGFLEQSDGRYRGVVSFFWSLLVLAGLALLLAQAAYVYRVQIASQVPLLRPVLVQACMSLHCTVDYPREIQQIAIMSSSLRANAKAGDTGDDLEQMTLQLTLRNNLDKPQEWPTLVLGLLDFSGAEIVKKNLPPDTYLSPAVLKGPFAAHSEVAVTVPITLKGVKINGFQLDKFFP
jgi:hypothetical protein